MIKIEHLNLTIHKSKILTDINLSLENGKIHGLVGRNGSGKTMLMKCICGFVHPTSGTVQIDGNFIGKDIDFPNDLGVIIETPEFIPYLSGFSNLLLLAKGRNRIGKPRIHEVMQLVHLDPNSRLHVKKYSLGMKQRLAIAQAIMESPKLLVLDEPLSALDEDGVHDIRKILLDFKQGGATIILSSHNAEDIRVLCDDVYRLRKGCMEVKSCLD
ncbi:MAG: ATP-binding cassette domain-containing protein [Eubacterium sp.]|nr:ATP-binding cassette domain-containing protein [Eubacterium sp.]